MFGCDTCKKFKAKNIKEEKEVMENPSDELFLKREDISDWVTGQLQYIANDVYGDNACVGNFYLIPLVKRENYDGPIYNNDMLGQSYLLSPDATFVSPIYGTIYQELIRGKGETMSEEMPWSLYDQDKTIAISMSTNLEITHVQPATSANLSSEEARDGFNRFLELINQSDPRIVACDLSFICKSPMGNKPMIITFTDGDCVDDVRNDLADFIPTITGASIAKFNMATNGVSIIRFKTDESDYVDCISGPCGLTSKSIKIYTVSVRLAAMNTPPVSVKLDVIAEDETEALEVAKQQLKLYFKNESIPVYPKVIAESVYDLVSERSILDK